MDEAQLRAVLRKLDAGQKAALLQQRLMANPLKWVARPDGAVWPLTWLPQQERAWEMFSAERRFITAMIGGNRMGKTLWALGALAETALGIPHGQWPTLNPQPELWALGPPKRIWCVTVGFEKSRDSQQRGVWERLPRRLMNATWNEKTGFSHRIVRLTNGTTIQFKSEEQEARTFESEALDLLWIDETINQALFMRLLARMVDRSGQIIMTTIPDDPWLDDLFVTREWTPDRTLNLRDKDVGVVTGTMYDNTLLSAEQIRTIEGLLSPEEKIYRIHGRFLRRRGLVYADYDADVHDEQVTPPLPVDWQANRWEVVDPGWRNPCAVGFACLDRAEVVHLYDEIHVTERTVGEVAAAIFFTRWRWAGKLTAAEALEFERLAQLTQTDPPPTTTAEYVARNQRLAELVRAWRVIKGECAPRQVLCDEYGLQKRQDAPVNFIQQLAEFGILAKPMRNQKRDPERMRIRQWLRPADGGLVRFRLNATCAWTRWEFRHHRFTEPDEQLKEFLRDEEKVVDGNNHHLVGLEYLAAERPTYVPVAAPDPPPSSPAGWYSERQREQARDWRTRG